MERSAKCEIIKTLPTSIKILSIYYLIFYSIAYLAPKSKCQSISFQLKILIIRKSTEMKTIVLTLLTHAFNSLKKSIFSKKTPPNTSPTGLYFSIMNGSGRITCGDCSFTQRLVSLMYITKDNIDTTCRGYQCQSCGTFKEVSSVENALVQAKSSKKTVHTATLETCGCGGTLEREKIVFCPQCQSKHLSYECIFKT
jgi:DNA-directed RNA polymerase subunit M/transcription elongation factor TFIIS